MHRVLEVAVVKIIYFSAIPSNVFRSIGNSNLVVWAEPEPLPSIQEVDAKAFCK